MQIMASFRLRLVRKWWMQSILRTRKFLKIRKGTIFLPSLRFLAFSHSRTYTHIHDRQQRCIRNAHKTWSYLANQSCSLNNHFYLRCSDALIVFQKGAAMWKYNWWTLINDLKVEKCSWPRNAKNANLFFVEKIWSAFISCLIFLYFPQICIDYILRLLVCNFTIKNFLVTINLFYNFYRKQ